MTNFTFNGIEYTMSETGYCYKFNSDKKVRIPKAEYEQAKADAKAEAEKADAKKAPKAKAKKAKKNAAFTAGVNGQFYCSCNDMREVRDEIAKIEQEDK